MLLAAARGANLKRQLLDRNALSVDHNVAFGFDNFPRISISQCQQPQGWDAIPPVLGYKRTWPSNPDYLAGDWSRSRTEALSRRHKLTIRASSPFFSSAGGVQDESNEDWFRDDQVDNSWPNVQNSIFCGDMADSVSAAEHTNIESKAKRRRFQDIPSSEFTISSRLKVPTHDITGVSPRRQSVPGVNLPFLAANGRQTTSSRGADNRPRARSQNKADSGAISRNGLLDLQTERDESEVGTGHEPFLSFPSIQEPIGSNEPGNNILSEGWHLIGPCSSHDMMSTQMDMQLPQRDGLSEWQLEDTSIPDTDPWSAPPWTTWTTLANLSPFSATQISQIEPMNISSNAATFSEICQESSEHHEIYTGIPCDNSYESTSNAIRFQVDLNLDKESPDLPGEPYLESANTTSAFWDPDSFTSGTNSYFTRINDISFSAPSSANYQLGKEYSQKCSSDYLDVLDNDTTEYMPSDLLIEGAEETSNPSHMAASSPSRLKSSTTLLLQPGMGHRQRHRKKQRKDTTTEPFYPRERESPLLILGSADFSGEYDDFSPSKLGERSKNIWASNQRVNSFNERRGETFSGGDGSESNLSEHSSGSETITDFSPPKQMPQNVPPEKRSRSVSHISAKFRHLKHDPDNKTPVLLLSEDTNETQPGVQDYLSQANRRSDSKGASSTSPLKITTTWEHAFIVSSDFKEVSMGAPRERSLPRVGRRTGPLDSASAENAKRMRKLGSCLRCRISKIKCSSDTICKPCQRASTSLYKGLICTRVHLVEYANLFLPEQAVRAFQKASVDRIISDNVSGFSTNSMAVFLSSGPTYPAIKIMVHEFAVRDLSFLAFKKFEYDKGNGAPTFKKAYSPPLGIVDFSQDLSGEMIRHIQEITKAERNYGEVVFGRTSQLAWDMYEAIWLYQQANSNSPFLQNILELHAMQNLMTISITILGDSSEEVLNTLRRPTQLEYSHNPSVRLINLQIKLVMLDLIRRTYLTVLEELEKQLRPNAPAQWAPAFCCIMILNMCAEMVQRTADARITSAMDDMAKSSNGRDKNGNKPSYEDSIHVSRMLDDHPISNATGLFHLINKTNKSREGMKREKAFNPIRDGLDDRTRADLDSSAEKLITDIRKIVTKHRDELESRAATPSFHGSSDPFKDHAKFRKRNSGRLVAAFLKSFL